MGACGAFQVARAKVRGGMLCVRACRRAPPAVCMPKRPRIRSARAGQRPAPRHHQGEGPTAKSGRDGALARARDTVKCCQNPGQVKSEPRSDRIRTGGQMNRNPQSCYPSAFHVCFRLRGFQIRSYCFPLRNPISERRSVWENRGRYGTHVDGCRVKRRGGAQPRSGGRREAAVRAHWSCATMPDALRIAKCENSKSRG